MKSSIFHCFAVEQPLRRRAFLAGVAGLAASAPFCARAAARLKIGDVADSDAKATALARGLLGQDIVLRGYFAPSVVDGEFALYEAPAAPCQLCGGLHDAGANLVVVGAEIPADVSMLRLIEVAGRVEIEGEALRLAAAKMLVV